MSINKDNTPTGYNRISISLASPEEILAQSSGEVLKPETINYRTYKPERDGLFCERIFGPVKDYECHCGKYKRIRYKGIVCNQCGVEVTEKKVRRERMGHISLVVPVVHIWYFKSLPSKIGYLLGIPSKKLEAIIYYERYVVINAGAAEEQGIAKYQTLAEKEYLDVLAALPKGNQSLPNDDPNKFVAQMGAKAIKTLLQEVDLDKMSYDLRDRASKETSQQRKSEILKQLNVITESSSLYHTYICEGARRFCKDFGIKCEFYTSVTPDIIRTKEAYLILNGQLDKELIDLARAAKEKKLKVGRDIGIISYNESPINEIVLNGLTTISTDFKAMGAIAARMILSKEMHKVKCEFNMIRRNTF